MDRRRFLERTSTLLAGAVLTPKPLTAGESRSGPPASGGRLVLPMNRNWRFSRTVVPKGHARDFDDSGFERVVVPHRLLPPEPGAVAPRADARGRAPGRRADPRPSHPTGAALGHHGRAGRAHRPPGPARIRQAVGPGAAPPLTSPGTTTTSTRAPMPWPASSIRRARRAASATSRSRGSWRTSSP
jgi:hypothetical protein